MTLATSFSWETVLADLAFILLILGAASGRAEPTAPPIADPASSPAAIWRGEGDADAFADWLNEQLVDPRVTFVIAIAYRSDQGQTAWQTGQTLARQVIDRGMAVRVTMRLASRNVITAQTVYEGAHSPGPKLASKGGT